MIWTRQIDLKLLLTLTLMVHRHSLACLTLMIVYWNMKNESIITSLICINLTYQENYHGNSSHTTEIQAIPLLQKLQLCPQILVYKSKNKWKMWMFQATCMIMWHHLVRLLITQIFLIFISNLPIWVTNIMNLKIFADDIKICKAISAVEDNYSLQEDQNKLIK